MERPRLRWIGLVQSVVGAGPVASHPDSHPFHELVLVVNGPYRSQIEGRNLRLDAGTGVLYPAGCCHAGLNPLDRTVRTYVVQWDGPAPADQALIVDDHSGRILSLLAWMWDQHPAADAATRDRLDLLLAALLGEALRPPGNGGDSLAERARNYMRQSLDRVFGMEELAIFFGLTPLHFARRFKAETGMPPLRYVQRLRVEKAVNLLRTTTLTFAEITRAAGLHRQSHLAALIRRETGRDPQAWRGAGGRTRQDTQGPRRCHGAAPETGPR